MFPGENRTHRTASQHQVARRSLPYSRLGFVTEDNTPASDMDYEARSTLVSQCLEAVARWHNHLPAFFALGPGLSSDAQLSVLHSRTTQQDLIVTQGMHSTQLNVVVVFLVVAALHSRIMVFVLQCFAAEGSASVGLLVRP